MIRETTGILVRETVPDSIFDEAIRWKWSICRLESCENESARKGYLPDKAAQAMENFFRGSNLGALREIAFRRTRRSHHAHMETARLASGTREQTWRISDTMLVCVGRARPRPESSGSPEGWRALSARAGSPPASRPPDPQSERVAAHDPHAEHAPRRTAWR